MEGLTYDAFGNPIWAAAAQAPQVGMVPELPPDPQMLAQTPQILPQGQTPLAGALAAVKPQMSFDLNAPQNQFMPKQSTEMSPNMEAPAAAGPSIGDQVGNAAKKLGNLTPEQVKSIQAMTGMTQRPNLPPPAAAIPRGTTGQMQQHQMAAPRSRMTLAQLIGMR